MGLYMSNKILDLFATYQQNYLLYNREAIVDKMLDDGVINFEDAEKILSGESLFSIDNNSLGEFKFGDNISVTEIWGGNFNKTQPKIETHFNRKIEPTVQPETQGDCWLLSDINSLSYTTWGADAINDAIIPDTDGSGGVTIHFKGSPIKQKEFHFTPEDIDKARKSGNYSEGDDDMIAFELATEITFKEMVRLGLAERCDDDEAIQRRGGKYRSYIWAGVKTDKFDQYPISELLGIKTYKVDILALNEQPTARNDKEKLFKWVSENNANIAGTCAFALVFDGYGDKNSKDYIHGGHAYAIKEVKYGKEVIITDPHYSDYDIKLPWDVFIEYVQDIVFSFKDDKTQQQFKTQLPKNYEANTKKSREAFDKALEEQQKQLQAQMDSLEAEFQAKKLESLKIQEEIYKKRELRIKKDIKNALDIIKTAKEQDNPTVLSFNYDVFNKDTIVAVLDNYPDIILWFDKKAYGWGKGSEKRSLISPIIEALADKARKMNINELFVSRFEKKCYKELNAFVYTDEKVIQAEVEKMLAVIKQG